MAALQITSADNKLFKTWVGLLASKGIVRQGLALVSGRKIVPELAAMGFAEGATLILHEDASNDGLEVPPDLRVAVLAKPLFETLDELGTGAPLLVLPVPEVAPIAADETPNGLVVGVAAQDPANLGAIMRSALAFGAAQLVLLEECANPFLPRVTRAASGSNFRLPLALGTSIRALAGEWVALDMTGEAIDDFAWPQNCRLLLGEEGLGVPAGFAGVRVCIPISEQMESLNVAVSAGIALASYRRIHNL